MCKIDFKKSNVLLTLPWSHFLELALVNKLHLSSYPYICSKIPYTLQKRGLC